MTEPLDPGPPLTEAGERLLVAAADLFYRHGIRAVGVDLVAERAGTTKKTLYDRFGSKDALVALYLRRHAHAWQRFLAERLDSRAPGAARALAVFDALADRLAGRDRGCAFVNAFAEIGGTDHPGVAVVRAEKDWMHELFVGLAGGAGAGPADVVGAQLHLLYEGATVVVTAGGRADAVSHARAAAAALLAGGPGRCA